MKIENSIALVTGAHGGIGRELVAELLRRGAAKVYVTARHTASLSGLLQGGDPRLVPLELDVTDADQVAGAALIATDVSLLVNNAGYAAFEGALAAPDLSAARREMETNYFGPLALARAFAPALSANGGGAMLNMLSMAALVSLPVTGTYAASKAAFLSVTRSLRAELAAQQTAVVGVLAVQTETAIGARLPAPRLAPIEVASDALDAVESGLNEEIAAGALTQAAWRTFKADPEAFQARMSSRLPVARASVAA